MRFEKKSSAHSDIITISIIAIALFGLSIQFKLFDKLFLFIVRYREYHLDEIVFVAVIIVDIRL